MRILLLIILMSCSSNKSTQYSKVSEDDCGSENDIMSKHLIISAKAQNNSMANCFKNFIRFEEDKTQSIYTCSTLKINNSGRVSYAYTRGKRGQTVPKDLKMCMEQSFHKMDFNSLQLDQAQTIQFPIEFTLSQ